MIIGREKEVERLGQALREKEAQFIAVYGRRRVGKTYLIREMFGDRFTFQHAGLSDGGMQEQLDAFFDALQRAGIQTETKPVNWMGAFGLLRDFISSSTEARKIIFLDELSWMDTPRCDLMTALEHFWNGWASGRKDVVLIVCSSATSWMLSHIIHNKGGLYNRLTVKIHLRAFFLSECEAYAAAKGLALNRMQILQCYMVFGGIPYYWSLLNKGKSPAQNVDDIIFAQDAPLREEFRYLYASVFRHPATYIRIVETLAKKKVGMTREELIDASGIGNTGDLSTKLEELESCAFIRKYTSYGKKKKNAVYQLTDAFTLFYYQFMEDRPTDPRFWSNQINSPRLNVWNGHAFERVCLYHVEQMKKKLGISGVHTESYSWYCKADPDKGLFGSQIDLLLVRDDRVINLCEMKYASVEYLMSKTVHQSIMQKISDFTNVTGSGYAIHPTLVTCLGLVDNSYANDIQAVITLDDLFENA